MAADPAPLGTARAQRVFVVLVDEDGVPFGTEANKIEVEANLEVGDITIGGVFQVDPVDGSIKARVVSDAKNAVQTDAALVVADPALRATGDATTTADQTVDGSSDVILAANPLRKCAIAQNTGTQPIRINFGAAAAPATGLQIAGGAIVTISSPWPVTEAIHAIREGASNSTVAVVEVVEV